jgi:uncharacterized protein (TIGR00297 family)
MRLSDTIIVSLLLLAGAVVSIRKKKLTVAAALTGVVVGGLLYWGDGYTGVVMLAVFFIMGTVATGWKKNVKVGAVQATRTTGQVIANGGVAALAGLGIICFPSYRHVLEVAMAGSISSAAADTLSSELGMVYGRSYYNILNLKRDQRGLDGVVSLEGLLIGVAGSAVIALVYALGHRWSGGFWIIVLSGTAGNLLDSVLGAAFERKGYIGNDGVNFLNTLGAGLLAGFLALAQ